MKKRRKNQIITSSLIICGIASFFLISFLNPWSEFNCRHQDINIKNGKARYTRYLFFIKISEEIKDTPLSLALQGKTVDLKKSDKEWHHVNTFSLGVRNSPHYIFHSALLQTEQLKSLALFLNLNSGEQKKIAENILKLWQETGRDS